MPRADVAAAAAQEAGAGQGQAVGAHLGHEGPVGLEVDGAVGRPGDPDGGQGQAFGVGVSSALVSYMHDPWLPARSVITKATWEPKAWLDL